AGYRTGQFGKWHLGDNYPYRPQDRGFQEAVYFPSSHIPSAPDFWNNDYFDDTYRHNGRLEKYTGYCTDVFFSEALRWLGERREADEPFFAYIASNAPHGPLFAPDQDREPYRDLPRNVASFYAMIANIDENVGRLEAFLADAGLKDNTILIFMTDNGGTAGVPLFNAGMRGRKIDLYDGGHRVPCFVRWPAGGLRPPGAIDELTHCQDLLPTLIELCGLERPAGAVFDGVSLAGLLRGREERLPDRMLVVQFSRMNAPQPKKGDAAVLWQKWRLVKGEELYDLRSDPAQQRNIAAEHPEIVQRMREHYAAWWSRVEPTLNDFSPIHVGSDAENPTLLSPCEWQDVFLDQAAQVRRGERKNGVWNILVERAGQYEISLRRWPVEADTPISAAVPEYRATDGTYPAGLALPITKARLRIGGQDFSRAVADDDKAATWQVTLPAGRTTLQTWFFDAQGEALCGAYYVSVRRQ
ncbi:MAG TPA: sulfatase-like hydrolase/transferase, partial [Planctomycetaceae bacterium]|nr:sulfatase-like hydrolase/transferase [Planctomycetaceae bacterium]